MFDDAPLPFLLVHGAVVWKLVLAGLVVILAAVGWWIDRRVVRAATRAGKHHARAQRVIGIGGGIVLLAAIGAKIVSSHAEDWRWRCRMSSHDDDFIDVPAALSNLDDCALAAASGNRDDALEAAIDRREQRWYRDEATIHQIAALSELRDGCAAGVGKLLDYERFEDAVAEATRCGDRRGLHLGLLGLGKLAEAAVIAEPAGGVLELVPGGGMGVRALAALPSPTTQIATGHWREAAIAADARATPYYACVAELFRHYAGDPSAAGKLRALADGPGGATCAPVRYELASHDERAVLLAHAGHDPASPSDMMLASLAWLDGASDVADPDALRFFRAGPDATLAAPEGREDEPARFTPNAWLAVIASPDLRSLDMLSWRTVAQVFDGDLTAAAATARQVQTLMETTSPRVVMQEIERDLKRLEADIAADRSHGQREAEFQQRSQALALHQNELEHQLATADSLSVLAALPALVALHTPSTSLELPASIRDDQLLLQSAKLRLPELALRRGEPSDREDVVVKAAHSGDAFHLAHEVGGRYHSTTDSRIMAVLPRITAERAGLVRQLRWARPAIALQPERDDYLFALAAHAVARRDTLRLAGESADAARWDAIYHRLAAVFKDRRTLIALLLWQQG